MLWPLSSDSHKKNNSLCMNECVTSASRLSNILHVVRAGVCAVTAMITSKNWTRDALQIVDYVPGFLSYDQWQTANLNKGCLQWTHQTISSAKLLYLKKANGQNLL
mmetsp:Transcript_23645/g.33023  ORF Transcript_23645/g.33023 Transcript_23645/m.33023 type:complete len:106 (+) Transcript_23645:760-1077(+)